MGTTPVYGLPYPEAETLITDSAAIVQELAEKIDALTFLSGYSPPDTAFTFSEPLVETITTSQLWSVPAGLTQIVVVVVGGGAQGDSGGQYSGVTGAPGSTNGGSGGDVTVARLNVTPGTALTVTVGGPATESCFHTISGVGATHFYTGPVNPYRPMSSRGGWDHGNNRNGKDGILITYEGGSTRVAAGGGKGGNSGTSEAFKGGLGGAGGGGNGGGYADNGFGAAGGTGSGGGGGGSANKRGGGGGSGVVLIFGNTPTLRDAPAPATVALATAIDDHDVVIGVYAVNDSSPELPGVSHHHLVPYPTEPIDTGRTETVPVDPDDPDGPTHDVPVMAWPEAGWKYTNNQWEEPK